jgi:hypothetical protein
MKAVRIVAMALGSVIVLYLLVTVFLPQWMIVGVHFRWPWTSDIVWLDVIGLVTAVSMLEAAIAGRGRTVAHGRVSYWQVAPWLRPILGIVGLGLLGFVVVHFLRTFYGF